MADNLVAVENPNAEQQAALKRLEEQRARVAASQKAIADAEAKQAAFAQRTSTAPGMSGTATPSAVPGLPTSSGVSNPLVDRAKEATNALTSKLGGGAAATAAGAKVQEQVKNLAEAKLAPTLFTTGPKDDLMAVDVLGISNSSILNNLAGKLSGFGLSAFESFRKNPGMLTDLTSMIRKDSSGWSFDAKSLTERVTSSLGGSANLFRNLSTNLQGTLTQGFGVDPSIYSRIEGTIGGVVQSFQSGNFQDARGIFNLVNQITGQSDIAQFFDVGAEANLLSGIFREAIQLGVPDAIDQLVEKAKSSTAADYALRGNIETAVSVSDLHTTALMIDRLGVNRVLSDVPDAAERLVASYSFPEGTTRDQYAARWTELKNVLDQLQPGWSTYNRNGTMISDLSLFNRASQDALTLFKLQPELAVAALIASSYPTVQLAVEGKQMYPYALI